MVYNEKQAIRIKNHRAGFMLRGGCRNYYPMECEKILNIKF
jgi:hypothetical protein